jgi:energy-coupling factor transport system permease protein
LVSEIKISLYILLVISLFILQDVSAHVFAACIVFLSAVILLPYKKLKSGFLPITIFLAFTFAGNLFFHPGRIIYSNSFLYVTDEGFRFAFVRTLRVFSMLFGAKILTGLLPVEEMVRAFERMLSPLQRIGVPVKDFFSVMALTLESFPVLIDYLGKTYREDVRNNEIRGFRLRIRHMVSFMMPVFVKSIRSPESFFGTAKKG